MTDKRQIRSISIAPRNVEIWETIPLRERSAFVNFCLDFKLQDYIDFKTSEYNKIRDIREEYGNAK